MTGLSVKPQLYPRFTGKTRQIIVKFNLTSLPPSTSRSVSGPTRRKGRCTRISTTKGLYLTLMGNSAVPLCLTLFIHGNEAGSLHQSTRELVQVLEAIPRKYYGQILLCFEIPIDYVFVIHMIYQVEYDLPSR